MCLAAWSVGNLSNVDHTLAARRVINQENVKTLISTVSKNVGKPRRPVGILANSRVMLPRPVKRRSHVRSRS
jgi:hypothetical protein